LGTVVGKLSRRIVSAIASKTSVHGMMPAHYPVLGILRKIKVATQADLTRLCAIEQPTMAATLNRMEKSGLIVRSADPTDARRQLVRLTEHGNKMFEIMRTTSRAVSRKATEGLTDEELHSFFRICEAMTANLEREA
jgi:DNA-binding MarR family transcriptional regulator